MQEVGFVTTFCQLSRTYQMKGKRFKTTVKRYLLDNSFCSLEEYFKLAMILVLFT